MKRIFRKLTAVILAVIISFQTLNVQASTHFVSFADDGTGRSSEYSEGMDGSGMTVDTGSGPTNEDISDGEKTEDVGSNSGEEGKIGDGIEEEGEDSEEGTEEGTEEGEEGEEGEDAKEGTDEETDWDTEEDTDEESEAPNKEPELPNIDIENQEKWEAVERILATYTYFSELSPEDAKLLIDALSVTEASFIECEEAEFTLHESLAKAQIMASGFTLNEALQMIQNHSGETHIKNRFEPDFGETCARAQAGQLNYYINLNTLSSENISELKGLILDGHHTNHAIFATIAANILDVRASEIIDEAPINLEESVGDEERTLNEIADIYSVNREFLLNYCNKNDFTIYELKDLLFHSNEGVRILGIEDEIVELLASDENGSEDPEVSEEQEGLEEPETSEEKEDTGESENFDEEHPSISTFASTPINESDLFWKYPTGQFSYNTKEHESVNLNNGYLTYSEDIVSLPGKSGFDLDLKLQYKSNEATREWNKSARVAEKFIAIGYADYNYFSLVSPRGYWTLETWYPVFLSKSRTDIPIYSDSDIADWVLGLLYPNAGPSGYCTFDVLSAKVYYSAADAKLYYDDCEWTPLSYQYKEIMYRDWKALPIPADMDTSIRDTPLAEIPDQTPLKNVAVGWSFNLTQIFTDAFGVKTLILSTGESFELGSVSSGKYTLLKGGETYNLQDVKCRNALAADITAVAGSAFVVEYVTGKKEYFDSSGNILAMVDKYSNKITFQQISTGKTGHTNVKVIDTLGREITIQYSFPTGSNIANRITITLPAQTIGQTKPVVELTLSQLSNTRQYTYTNFTKTRYRLVSKIDPAGHTTSFEYRNSNNLALFNFYQRDVTNGNGYQQFEILQKVKYPTGLDVSYDYSIKKEPMGMFGERDYFALTRRSDTMGASTSYVYSSKTQSSDPNAISYNTEVACSDNGQALTTRYYFQVNHLLNYFLESGASTRNRTNYEYNANKQVIKKETLYGTTGVSAVEQFEYDTYGNMTAHYGTRANGTKSTEYKTTYQYSVGTGTFNMLTSVTYKKDASTTVAKEYTLTIDKKTVSAETIKENGVVKSKIVYEGIDSFGYPSVKKNYTSDTNYIQTDLTYNSNFLLKSEKIGGVGNVYEYYDNGLLKSSTDGNGNKTSYEYDALGRTTKVTNPDNTYSTNAYVTTISQNRITSVDAAGKSVRYDYDTAGNITSVTDVTGGNRLLKTCTYYPSGIIKTETDGKGNTTSYTYDAFGRILSKIVGSASAPTYKETYIYDTATNLKTTKTIDGLSKAPNIVTTEYYSINGYIEKTGFKLSGIEYFNTFTYDYVNNKISELSAKDAAKSKAFTKQYKYDFAGRVIEAKDLSGATVYTVYDFLGRKTSETDPKGSVSSFVYDNFNRLIQENRPFEGSYQAKTVCTYDNNGNVKSTKVYCNKPGQAEYYSLTEYDYNNRNLLTEARSYNGSEVESRTIYTYDAVGNKTSMTVVNGANRQTTTYTYKNDAFNRLASVTDPLGQAESYDYDINGNLTKAEDRNKVVKNYTYDVLNRPLITAVTGANEFLEYTYTGTGALYTDSNERLTVSYIYDDLGRVTQQTESNGIKKIYSYDLAGNRTGFRLLVNNVEKLNLTYVYDDVNRLIEVKSAGVTTAVYTYDANGNRATMTNRNGTTAVTTTEYTYNKANMVTKLTNKKGTSVISEYTYTYYLDGNQASKTDNTGRITTYTYDGLGRLVSEAETRSGGFSQTYTYAYDKAGNRLLLTATGSGEGSQTFTSSYEYDKNNRLLTETKESGGETTINEYAYDPNGNQISKMSHTLTDGNGSPTLGMIVAGDNVEDGGLSFELNSYDGFNRLKMTENEKGTALYTYKPDGLRLSKKVNGTLTTHIWDGSNIVVELNAENNVVDTYIRGINLIKSTNNGYYLYNAHGDVVQLTNATGTVTKNYHYDAFGVEFEKNVGDLNPFRYCGEYYDLSSGTYYLRNRYYNPNNGRFLTEDPIKAGLNFYTYCGNNPLSFIDPWGLAQVAIRDFIESRDGLVNWNAKTSTSTFKLNNRTLTTLASGKNSHGLTITNSNGRLMAEQSDLIMFFKLLEGKTIVIDPGHGGDATGATTKYNGTIYNESNLNLSLGSLTSNYLTRAGATVVMSRTTDKDVGLSARAQLANDANADLFLSIHHNSAGNILGSGTTAIYPNSHHINESKSLATLTCAFIYANGLRSKYNLPYLNPYKDPGSGTNAYTVLAKTNMPASIIEVGYMSNNMDYIVNEQDRTARAILSGVEAYYND